MKTLTIEWKHLDRDGETCDRCGDTGRALRRTVQAMRRQCRASGIVIKFRETKLPARRLKESNTILFNGVPLETALGDANVRANACGSCSTLVGQAAECRTVRRRGKTYEAIPDALIWEAACRVACCTCPAAAACQS
jgi:Domain of unknown function (DUF2703)